MIPASSARIHRSCMYAGVVEMNGVRCLNNTHGLEYDSEINMDARGWKRVVSVGFWIQFVELQDFG